MFKNVHLRYLGKEERKNRKIKENRSYRIKQQTCIQTSLESPWTRMCLYPFLTACLKPKITARYSATLFVAMPTPSRNRQTYQSSELERATLKTKIQNRNLKSLDIF